MLLYVKNIFQLLLAPSRGWEDVSAGGVSFDRMLRSGFVPLVILTALTEFIPLAYYSNLTFLGALGSAIAVGGGLFASLFASRLVLDVALSRYIKQDINMVKVNNLALYLVGFDCFYRIFSNILPGSLTFLYFLPLISIVVLFKSTAYLGIEEEKTINYIFISFVGVVIIPALICWLLLLII